MRRLDYIALELADTQTANDRIIQISMIAFSKSPTLWTLGSGERGRGQKGRFVHTLDLAHIAYPSCPQL